MFNTNVGEMPLDIFSDYISDILGEEWHWEYLAIGFNNHGNHIGIGNIGNFFNCEKVAGYGFTTLGNGTGYSTSLYTHGFGFWQGDGYGCG